MNLSSRLIISFAFIILITLCISFATLLAVSRPIQNRLNRAQLVNQSRLAARQVDTLLNQGNSVEEIIERINRSPRLDESHLLLIDPTGRVLADTQANWVGQTLTLNNVGQVISTSNRSGRFQTPNGEEANFGVYNVGDASNPRVYAMAVDAVSAGLPNVFSQLGTGYILAGVVSLLMSLLIGMLIARSIALPLQRISKATTAVAAGDYSVRVPESGPPDIRRVSATFNIMASQVEASQTTMRDFVSNVSHELKTPLTSIKGFSQALMEGATQDDAARRRAAEIIYQEASRMSRLVEDLLDLARIDSGQVVMNKSPLDLTQILSSTVDRLLPQAVNKQIAVVKKWDDLPTVVGDGDRLAQVFTNLLDNALRHTPADGQITITARVVENVTLPQRVASHLINKEEASALSTSRTMIKIGISDTGPGIPPDDLARIFERFYQIDKSRPRGGGAGLGLTIIKQIIEAHNGYVDVQSEVGVGTTFVIALPLTESSKASPRK